MSYNECMIFLPNMRSTRQVLSQIAPNLQALEVIQSLYSMIPGYQVPIENLHLVDTNLNNIIELSYYITLPQD